MKTLLPDFKKAPSQTLSSLRAKGTKAWSVFNGETEMQENRRWVMAISSKRLKKTALAKNKAPLGQA